MYRIVKWFVEVYGPVDFTVPAYQDPSPQMKQSYEITEIEERLKSLEKLLVSSLQKPNEESREAEVAATIIETHLEPELPGFINYSYASI